MQSTHDNSAVYVSEIGPNRIWKFKMPHKAQSSKDSKFSMEFFVIICSLNGSFSSHIENLSSMKRKLSDQPRLMPFRPLFPCVPWSRGTNNITLK